MPESPPATIVHGDYRLGNVMRARGAARLAAIFDWEMSTIGDPLADLGYLCTFCGSTDDDPPRGMFELSRVTRAGGLPARASSSRATRSARPLDGDIRWYQVLALWKSIVFMEGNYRRDLPAPPTIPTSPASGRASRGWPTMQRL